MSNSLIQSNGNGYPVRGPVIEAAAPPPPNSQSRRYFQFLLRYWWIPFTTLILGTAAALALNHWAQPEYVSSAAMWETEKLLLPGGAAFSADGQTYMGTQLELLHSGGLLRRTVSRMQALDPKSVPLDKDGNPPPVTISDRQVPKTTVFEVEASSPNPEYCQAFLDSLLNVYLDYKKTVRKTVSGDTLASITEQITRCELDLKSQQDALHAYEKSNNLAVVQEQGKVAGAYLESQETKLSELRLELQLLDATNVAASAKRTQAVATADPDDAAGDMRPAFSTPAGPGQLSAADQVVLLKVKRDHLSKNLRPQHPKIIKLDNEIAQYQKIIEIVNAHGRDDIAATRTADRQRMTNLLESIQDWQKKVIDADARMAEAETLKENVARIQSVYDRLTALLQNVDISRNIDQETLAVLQPASMSQRSLAGEVKTLALSILGGLVLGLALVFWIMVRDDRFNSLDEVNEKFGDVVVGQVPYIPRLKGQKTPLLALDDPREMYAESYRNLRSAIFFMPCEGTQPKILMIASAQPGEGKSTISANLGRTLAQGSTRVLVIDADLRKGHLHKLLGMRPEPGLADYLSGSSSFEEVLQTDSRPNLFFISRGKGTTNPGDLFLDPKLDELFGRLRKEFDYVLVDTCPVFAADDAPTLAPRTDGTLFVVRNGFSQAGVVKEALDVLGQRQVKVLGLVFNRADSSARSYYYYKHADYYTRTQTA